MKNQSSLNRLGLRSCPGFIAEEGGLAFFCCSGVWGELEYEDELELDPALLVSA